MEEIEIKTDIGVVSNPLGVVDNKPTVTDVVPKKRGKGRPPKADLEAVRESRKGKVGRPKGDNGRLQEFKDRLLATGGTRILDKMISIALDDDHPGQMAAIKLAVDRILPMSAFDAAKNAGSTPQVTINISSINEPKILDMDDSGVIDV
jgi:hypothetical protein